MTGSILGVVAVAAFVVWALSRLTRRRPGPRHGDPIDYDELQEAENEVRDLGASVGPDDDVVGDDWGPGASRRSPRD